MHSKLMFVKTVASWVILAGMYSFLGILAKVKFVIIKYVTISSVGPDGQAFLNHAQEDEALKWFKNLEKI